MIAKLGENTVINREAKDIASDIYTNYFFGEL